MAKGTLKSVQKLLSDCNLWQIHRMSKNTKIHLLRHAAALAALVLLPACSFAGSGLVLDPVGPSAGPAAAATDAGTLVVYSAYSVNAPSLGDPSYRQRYSNYKILSPNGQLLRAVANDAGLTVAAPVAVALPPGSYRVVARANGYGFVQVPVVVAAGRATTVHLEGGSSAESVAAADAVRLPDGRIIGWRAQP
jgi:hypothetical protein